MIATLKKHGNSHALIINRATMETLGIDGDTPLQIVAANGSLVITPANVGVGEDRVRESVAKLRKRYTPMLKRLAE